MGDIKWQTVSFYLTSPLPRSTVLDPLNPSNRTPLCGDPLYLLASGAHVNDGEIELYERDQFCPVVSSALKRVAKL